MQSTVDAFCGVCIDYKNHPLGSASLISIRNVSARVVAHLIRSQEMWMWMSSMLFLWQAELLNLFPHGKFCLHDGTRKKNIVHGKYTRMTPSLTTTASLPQLNVTLSECQCFIAYWTDSSAAAVKLFQTAARQMRSVVQLSTSCSLSFSLLLLGLDMQDVRCQADVHLSQFVSYLLIPLDVA